MRIDRCLSNVHLQRQGLQVQSPSNSGSRSTLEPHPSAWLALSAVHPLGYCYVSLGLYYISDNDGLQMLLLKALEALHSHGYSLLPAFDDS